MTYREKLKQEYPENVSDIYAGGCKGCPKTYGYGPEGGSNGEICIAWQKSAEAHIDFCRQCWDREIPEEEPADAVPDVNDVLEALQRLHENAHMTTLTAAFYNVASTAVEDYGGNTERLCTYLRGICDLMDAVAALMTEEEGDDHA